MKLGTRECLLELQVLELAQTRRLLRYLGDGPEAFRVIRAITKGEGEGEGESEGTVADRARILALGEAVPPINRDHDWENDTQSRVSCETANHGRSTCVLNHGLLCMKANSELGAQGLREPSDVINHEYIMYAQSLHMMKRFVAKAHLGEAEVRQWEGSAANAEFFKDYHFDMPLAIDRNMRYMSQKIEEVYCAELASQADAQVEEFKPRKGEYAKAKTGIHEGNTSGTSNSGTGNYATSVCSHCGKRGHSRGYCWDLHPELKARLFSKPCTGCEQPGHLPAQCWALHPELKPFAKVEQAEGIRYSTSG